MSGQSSFFKISMMVPWLIVLLAIAAAAGDRFKRAPPKGEAYAPDDSGKDLIQALPAAGDQSLNLGKKLGSEVIDTDRKQKLRSQLNQGEPERDLSFKTKFEEDSVQKKNVGNTKKNTKIVNSVECSDDAHRFCTDKINNFQVLDCLQDSEKTDDKLSPQCHHYLWQYKRKLTTDPRFDEASFQACESELSQIKDCSQMEKEKGQGVIIPCLIENFENITSRSCRAFIDKMANIVFSDYRMMSFFIKDCDEDITSFQCGRLHSDDDEGAVHFQGATVNCLEEHLKQLAPNCKTALMHVAELQADDYHRDRPLYYACRNDRFNLCSDIAAGNGAVFKCLYRHLGDKRLSSECREKLELREKLVAEDVKVDKVFYESCAQDIKKNRCGVAPNQNLELDEDLGRSNILLCLEKAQSDGKKVKPKCLQEMFEMRSELMQDYKISPELVSACQREIEQHCDGGLEYEGETIKCLMKEIMDRDNKQGDDVTFTSACRAQVEDLLAVANPGENIKLDPTLQRACGDVVHAACSTLKAGDGDVITCLYENLDHEEMTDECEDRLLELQYFATRDFRLDHHLFKKCRKDAKKFCNSDGFGDSQHQAPEEGPRVFSCLQHLMETEKHPEKKPSHGCSMELKRVILERSTRIKLLPEVEAACRGNLVELCSDDEEHKKVGGEMECLQDNLEDLSPECQALVSNFTEKEYGDLEMDRLLMKACTPMIKLFCEDLLHNDAMPDEVLECLIKNKVHSDMDEKCAAGIEHHQIISLKEFRFNHKFRKACEEPVQTLCKTKKTKYEVVACLSEHVRNDTLMGRDQRIPQKCRKQLQFEMLQRAESLKLDPDLAAACKQDIPKFCKNERDSGGEIIECLHKHKKKLSNTCHKMVFQREKDDALFGDYTILHVCKKMIKSICNIHGAEDEILECLMDHKDDDEFDDPCRKVINRRMVEQSHDIRLDPHLQKACRPDIHKYCANIYDQRVPDQELEGQVIDCLKRQYTSKRKPLTKECEHEVQSRIKEAALDINKNPVVIKYCKQDIKSLCTSEIKFNVQKMTVDEDEDEDNDENEYTTFGTGKVVECLKKNFAKLKNKNCKQEIAFMIAESKIDVQVDPLLHRACQKDLITICEKYQQGQGRKMSCLLSYLETDPDAMTSNCRILLQQRKDLWEYAAEVAPMESFSEVFDQLNVSPARNYFFAVIFTAIGLIFIFGLTCGRVTKRVRAELKNK